MKNNYIAKIICKKTSMHEEKSQLCCNYYDKIKSNQYDAVGRWAG